MYIFRLAFCRYSNHCGYSILNESPINNFDALSFFAEKDELEINQTIQMFILLS